VNVASDNEQRMAFLDTLIKKKNPVAQMFSENRIICRKRDYE
jgi:hypothetical protein